jgi:hypothetical protein
MKAGLLQALIARNLMASSMAKCIIQASVHNARQLSQSVNSNNSLFHALPVIFYKIPKHPREYLERLM